MIDTSGTDNSALRSLVEIQRAHVELMQRLKPNLGSGDQGSARPTIQGFVARVKVAGAGIEDPAERQAAQNILDYWSAETVSITDVSEKDWSPEKLDAFDPEQAGAKGPPSDEKIAARLQARKKIQLAAAARLWKDSGRANGYLLHGTALEEAANFATQDPDIGDLVFASRNQVGAERRNIVLALAFVGLCAVIAWLLLDRAAERQKLSALEAQRSVTIAERSAERSAEQVETQQAKIKVLTQELKTAKVPVPSDITETVPDGVAIVQSKDRANSSGSNASEVLRGYVWLGSDAAPNLIDPATGSPVKPSAAAVGASYKVTKNLVLRTAAPSQDYLQSDSAGIVPEQTVIKLRSAPLQYRRPAPAASKAGPAPVSAPAAVAPAFVVQYWAQVDVENSDQPIVYVEYAGSTAQIAQAFAQRLKEKGFRIPGVETTDLAKGLNEVRYFHAADQAAAERLFVSIAMAMKDMRVPGLQPVRVLDFTGQRGSRNFPGVLELWVDLSTVK